MVEEAKTSLFYLNSVLVFLLLAALFTPSFFQLLSFFCQPQSECIRHFVLDLGEQSRSKVLRQDTGSSPDAPANLLHHIGQVALTFGCLHFPHL